MSGSAADTFLKDREKLIAIACSIVGDQATAEDVVQDSWLRWSRSRYAEKDARPLFRVIVANIAKDWRRRKQREVEWLKFHTDVEHELRDAERIVLARQEILKLVQALKQLPPRQVLAFRLRRIQGQTYAEISKTLKIAPSRVHADVANVIAHLTLTLLD